MFCSNCGKQIPDNTKFCNFCGAQQPMVVDEGSAPKTTVNQPKVADAPTQKPKAAPKKKANIFIILAAALGAFLIGKFIIAPSFIVPSMVSGSETNYSSSNKNGQSQQNSNGSSSATKADNPAYKAIFDNTYIIHFQNFFGMEMECFAMKKDDGKIACADYGYKDDVVKQWVETVYIPVSEYTDAQKAEVETTFKTQFASLDALNCCVVTYKMSTNYFTITFTYSDVDKSSSYSELYSAGILQTNTPISMSATESFLLSQGFVKK